MILTAHISSGFFIDSTNLKIHFYIIFAVFFLFLIAEKLLSQVSNSPEWARGAIWYQIFPDRFENGDTTNDPVAYPMGKKIFPWQISRWTSNWYNLSDEEKLFSHNFYTNAGMRGYGGDLSGIIKRLDYLSNLGINVILLTPIFEASSFHRYDVRSYHHIDETLGSPSPVDSTYLNREIPDNPKTWYFTSSDRVFLKFIEEAHKRNIKVVLELLLNHVGVQFWAFQDVVKNQQSSKYAQWFKVIHWDRPETPDTNEFDYKSVWGLKAFPELKVDSLGLAPGANDYLYAVTRRWMDPNADGNPTDGIDGWKIQFVSDLPNRFLNSWIQYVKKINSGAVIVGEVWGKEKKNIPNYDCEINLMCAQEAVHLFLDSNRSTPTLFDAAISELRDASKRDADYSLNVIDTPETDRTASMVLNTNRDFDEKNSAEENGMYIVRQPTLHERKLQEYIIVFQFTFPGSPIIYYGDEAGMWGGDDPDCKKPMLWFDKIYEDECSFPVNADTTLYQNQFDSTIYSFYRKLIQLRKEHLALQVGSMHTLILDDAKLLYGYKRKSGDDEVYIIFNTSKYIHETMIPLSGLREGTRIYDPIHDLYFFAEQQSLTVSISPKTAIILIPAK